jgi:hypothetical protein
MLSSALEILIADGVGNRLERDLGALDCFGETRVLILVFSFHGSLTSSLLFRPLLLLVSLIVSCWNTIMNTPINNVPNRYVKCAS